MGNKRGQLKLYRGSFYDCLSYMGVELDLCESSNPYNTIVVSNDGIGYRLNDFIKGYTKIVKDSSKVFLMFNTRKNDFRLIQLIKNLIRDTGATVYAITTDRDLNYLNSLANRIYTVDGDFYKGKLTINASLVKGEKQLAIL